MLEFIHPSEVDRTSEIKSELTFRGKERLIGGYVDR
jgi:hypothetical protein